MYWPARDKRLDTVAMETGKDAHNTVEVAKVVVRLEFVKVNLSKLFSRKNFLGEFVMWVFQGKILGVKKIGTNSH